MVVKSQIFTEATQLIKLFGKKKKKVEVKQVKFFHLYSLKEKRKKSLAC